VRRRPAIIDTNVVVAALLTSDSDAPTARILDGMIGGSFPFVLSVALLAEYRRVLTRDRIRERHGLTTDQVDGVLSAIAANAIVREAVSSEETAPDPGDQHLWDLLAGAPDAVLVTGDKRLLENAPNRASVLLPGSFID
jgi:putative PIN family toxin of toxin-antitoxin system